MKYLKSILIGLICLFAVWGIARATLVCYPEEGCTGTSEIPLVGQLLTGSSTPNGNVYRPLYLSAGSNITISTSSDGTITLTVSGLTPFTTTTITDGTLQLSSTAYTFNSSSSGVFTVSSTAPSTLTWGINGGYSVPFTASTTNWESFYQTPSGRITAGDGINWSVNTLNADYNTTNLQITASQLNTIQNINTTAQPTFASATLSNFTAGSVPFIGTSGRLQQNNSQIFWDNTNETLLIGTSTFYGGQVVTTPRLEIAGAVNIRNNGATDLGTYDVEIMSNDSAGTWLSILNNGSRNYFGTLLGKTTDATSTFQLYNETAGPIQFFTNNNERLRIDENGKFLFLNNVGFVGGMPYSTLDVNFGSNITGLRMRGGITAGARQSEIWDAFINTTGGINFTGASSTDTNAYFGIDPKSSLEEGLKLWDGGSGNYTGSVYSNFYVKDAATDYLNISVNATSTQFVIDSNGNIGIATSTPKSKLTVSDGDIYIASSTTVGGLILTSPNGSCYRVQITNGGDFTTSSITCP